MGITLIHLSECETYIWLSLVVSALEKLA